MYKEKEIIKLVNKKYFLNEFVIVKKVYEKSYEVLVVDNLNFRIYFESDYPESLFEESKSKKYSKKDFINELHSKTIDLLKNEFSDIYLELQQYDEQKSLF